MWSKRRYHEIFFMIDTCQAASMYQEFYSPNILAVASSLVGEDSLSHHIDTSIGVYIIDRYTYHALEFLEGVTRDSKLVLVFYVSYWFISHFEVAVRQFLYFTFNIHTFSSTILKVLK